MTDKIYSRVKDAEKIIKDLCEKYPQVFWAVKPDRINVLGIENKQRSDKNKVLAKIKPMRGLEKAIMEMNQVGVDYVIELYWSDFNVWSSKLKKLILAHEILHVSPDHGKTVKHDCEDFRIFLDAFGVDWSLNADKLPDILDENVKFNLNLLPSLEQDHTDGENNDADEE